MLDRNIGECMVSIINISNGIKEPTCGHQNCDTEQMLIFGGYVKVTEYSYAQVLYLGQHHSKLCWHLCMVCRTNWYKNNNTSKNHTRLVSKSVKSSL